MEQSVPRSPEWRWLANAIVLHLEREHDDGSAILETPASGEGGPIFRLEYGRKVAAMS